MEVGKTGIWPWLLQRISGLYLIFGMITHFWILHFVKEGKITFDIVSARFFKTGWVLFDASLLAVALYHGLNGVWAIIVDYNPDPDTKKTVGYLITAFGFFMFFYGLWALSGFIAPLAEATSYRLK